MFAFNLLGLAEGWGVLYQDLSERWIILAWQVNCHVRDQTLILRVLI